MGELAVPGLKPEALSWDGALRLFFLRCRSAALSEATQENYRVRLGIFRDWVRENGDLKPCEIRAGELRGFLEARRKAGNRASTLDALYRVLRTFFLFLSRDGLLLLNPADKLERPRQERRLLRPFRGEDLAALLSAIETGTPFGVRDYALILLLADTGLRISEALGLKVGEIDWSNNSARILGKGGKERVIAFGQRARRGLMLWLSRRGAAQDGESLFVDRFGQALKRTHVEHRIKGYTIAAKIAARGLNAHSLRHYFAVAFLRNGGSIRALQLLLGHSSLATTQRYLQLMDSEVVAEHRQASPLDRMGALPGERRRVRLK